MPTNRFQLCFLFVTLPLLASSALDKVDAKPEGEVLPEDASDAEILAGHSYHGEFLNEGPRQSAYLMKGTGAVDFPVTSDSDEAKAFVAQGLGQFYGFWYLEAERSFRHAANLDPECAMAYWGAALATKSSPKRSKGFIGEAVKLKDKVSRREHRITEEKSHRKVWFPKIFVLKVRFSDYRRSL